MIPPTTFGFPISDRCEWCSDPAKLVAVVPPGESEADLRWGCFDHMQELKIFIQEHGCAANQHLFAIPSRCHRSDLDGAVSCGAAVDYIVVFAGGSSMLSACKRHRDIMVGPSH
jgi:hypothetical protein